MPHKTLDVICLGRVAVDLYGEQIGGRLEDMRSFAKYVGGSSGNMCIGMARQGLRTAMLSRVGDEHMGRFIREQLVAEGVDVSHLVTDDTRLTGLVLLGIRDRDTFPLIFYRNDCADMALCENDFDEDFIASAKALVITGTHFSTESTKRTCETAIQYARRNGTRTVLDIDYRPVLWGLTGAGLGEERFVPSSRVSERIQDTLRHFDLIVGTREEFLIAGGSDSLDEALRSVREICSATLVVKGGEQGVGIFPREIPPNLVPEISVPALSVEVCNVLGAGDGFMAGFMRGWINDEPLAQSALYANGCGALVVSRHGCSPAIPGKAELDHYLAHGTGVRQPDSDPVLRQMHRIAMRKRSWNQVCILAFDHRRQLEEAAKSRGISLPSLKRLKELVFEGARSAANTTGIREPGIIVDGNYGDSVLTAATGTGWFIGRPVELSGSRPLAFESGDDIFRTMHRWPSEHVAKCLVVYSVNDEAALCNKQEQRILRLFEACVEGNRELLLEVIPPTNSSTAEDMVATLKRFYDIGVYPDWWKLPQQTSDTWGAIGRLIRKRDPDCRGVVILGLDAPFDQIAQSFRAAAGHELVKGFAIGRSIFYEHAKAWLSGSIDDGAVVQSVAQSFSRVIDLWLTRDSHSAARRASVNKGTRERNSVAPTLDR